MGIDYGEVLCTAVDEIVSARMQGLKYDITKLCTIVDDTNSYQGKYVVSDGTARYEAFTTDNNLKKGNSVLVTIPNGDYSMQKIIKGRIAATDTTPFKYTSPLDTMISIKNDLLDINQPDWVSKDRGLVANYENDSITDVIYSVGADTRDSVGNMTGSSGFTRLGVSADFKSLLSGFDVLSGSYGLKIVVYSESIEKPGIDKNVVYVLDFNSADMIGNPYQFEEFFSQEKVFDISYINKIKRIDVYFYQGNNFIDGNGEYIPFLVKNNYDTDMELRDSLQPDNLFIDNVKLYLGYDKNEFKDETLMIYTDNTLNYHYKRTTKENRKSMELRWIHKINENEFTLLQSSDIDNINYFVKWYRYSPGWEDVDKYAGKDWQEISAEYSKPMVCDFDPDVEKQQEQIKVIGIIRDGNTVTIQGNEESLEKSYFSNLLTFENEEQVPDTKTWDAASALQIICEDNSEGNYYIYNQNGKINNQGIGQGYIRYLKAYFKGAEITSDIGTLDYIKWYIPKNKTMMIYTKNFGTENGGSPSPEAVTYKQVEYQVIERKPKEEANVNGKFEFTSSKQAYSIANQWSYQNSNNTVRCQVSIDGVVYEAAEELRFGKSGTNGTNVTLVLEFDDNANALIAGEGNKVSVSAWMYNEEGARTGFTESSGKKIEWSWYKRSSTSYMSLPKETTGDKITIYASKSSSPVPKDNYFILQATYDNLTAYLSIPIKSAETSFIEGAREIIYNHQGIPSYYNDAYNIYCYINNQYKKVKNAIWELTYNESFNDKYNSSKGYIPTLKDLSNGGKALSAAPFFASGYNDNVCIKGSATVKVDEEETIECAWAQPILIMQSRYDFAMLNDWDGKLTLDEENGTILSTMLGAGRKNNDNSFSGVLIGDIQKGTQLDEANTLTGVYGLQKGVISYSLTEDGRATLGANGNGQIIIDGSESLIKTKGYDTVGSSGMLIDLNTGLLDIRNDKHQSLIHLSAGLNKNSDVGDPYFLIQTQEGQQLIKIDDKEYFLQSNNFKSERGSKYDLMTGEIYVAGTGGNFKVSPQAGDSLLEVNYINGNDKTALLKVGGEDYFLQSKNYAKAQAQKVYTDKTFKTEEGDLYSISGLSTNSSNHQVSSGGTSVPKITIINNEIYKAELDPSGTGKYYKGVHIIFDSISSTSSTADNSKTDVVLTAEQNKQRFILKAIKDYGSEKKQYQGFKLDLNANLIEGYNLYLRGIKENDNNKQIIIDSGAPEYPLQVGQNFAVNWDGKVTCTNPTISGSEGTINLGSFYINSSGAGGGTWSGNSLGVAGYGGVPLSSLASALSWTVYVK